jgi:hypothetical protein
MTQLEIYAQEGLRLLGIEDGDGPYHQFYLAWNEYRYNPAVLKEVTNYYAVGCALSMFISYGTVSDIDIRQSIASVAYMFLSLAIEQEPNNDNYYTTRVILMHEQREALEYTVSSVVNKDMGFMFMNLHAFKSRDALFKMIYHDLAARPALVKFQLLSDIKNDLENKIKNNFFANQTQSDVYVTGKRHHQEVLEYIKEKVLEDEDIDF